MGVRFGLDSTSQVPVVAHHAVGSTVAIRYLSRFTSKVVTRAEHDNDRANGIETYLVFEDFADNPLKGYDQGKADAEFALNQAKGILGPPSPTWRLPFAADYDPNGREGASDPYYDGTAAVFGRDRCGPYGGYSLCAHLNGRGFRGIYSTYAWSGGQVLSTTHGLVHQFSNDHVVGGVGVDFDRIFPAANGDFGQYNFTTPPAPDPHHYNRFPTADKHAAGAHGGPFPSKWGPLDERQVVMHYDGARLHPVRYRLYLKKLEAQCRFLADRIWTVTHQGLDLGEFNLPPNWTQFHRGWRYQQLAHRSKGEKLV